MTNMLALLEVNSTSENLQAVGQLCPVRVRKTMILIESKSRASNEVQTLQVSYNVDA